VDGERIRQFTADEIVAFARCFELPVTWFFLPPPARVPEGCPVNIAVPDEPQWGITPAVMVDLLYGNGAAAGLMDIRVQNFFHDLEADRMTAAQHTTASAAKSRVRLVMSKAIGRLPDWQIRLRAMANARGLGIPGAARIRRRARRRRRTATRRWAETPSTASGRMKEAIRVAVKESGDDFERVDVARPHDGEVTAIQRGEFCDVEPFSDRDDGRIDEPEAEVGVHLDQLDAALVVVDGEIDHVDPSGGDEAKQAGFCGGAEATFDEPGRLGHDGRRDGEIDGVPSEHGATAGVVSGVPVGGGDKDAGFDQHQTSKAFGPPGVGGVSAGLGDVEWFVASRAARADECLQWVVGREALIEGLHRHLVDGRAAPGGRRLEAGRQLVGDGDREAHGSSLGGCLSGQYRPVKKETLS
jgi:hypothetical protein